MNKKIIKYSLLLIALGVIAGLLLSLVNSITLPVIEERAKAEIKAKLEQYYPFADYSENQADKLENVTGEITEIYYGYNEAGKVEAVIYLTITEGYGGPVVVMTGIKADGKVIDAKVINVDKETPGLGSRAKGYDFKVANDTVTDYSYETITGATVTSTAVHQGIDAAIKQFRTIQGTLGGTNE